MISRSLVTLFVALNVAGCGERGGDREPQPDRYPAGEPGAGTGAVPERPVQIGFDGPRFDACASYGRVTNLNPSGDNALPVLSAPAGSAEEVDTLAAGHGVSICQKLGDWLGVVYAPEASEGLEPINCGTGSPVADVRVYDGRCRSGWVNENYIQLFAG